MRDRNELIKEICDKNNIKVSVESNSWINILEKNGKIKYIAGYYFDCNPCATMRIIDDKYALYSVLNHFNIPVCKHHLLYEVTPKNEVLDLFNKYNQKVVIKANAGRGGTAVFKVEKEEDLFNCFKKIYPKYYSASLMPYYEVKMEYRLVALNGKIKLIYGKIKPEVLGDGKSSIKELLLNFNPEFFKDKELPEDVLPQGELYSYNWQFNLARGAKVTTDIPEDKKAILSSIAYDILKVLQAKFVTIDIIETDDGFKLLEMNSGISINKFMSFSDEYNKIGMDIYEEAILSLFDE